MDKLYLVIVKVGTQEFDWRVFAENSSEAIRKASWELEQEMRSHEEIKTLMVKEVKMIEEK